MSTLINTIIAKGVVSPSVMALMQQPALEALALLRGSQGEEWRGQAQWVIEDSGKITAISQGDDSIDATTDVANYGAILLATIVASGVRNKRLRRIAMRCMSHGYSDIGEVHLALERVLSSQIYVALIVIIIVALAILYFAQYFL